MQNQNYTYLNRLESNASIFWREINPKATSCFQLKRLLDMYATFEQWENVINLSSRAVLHLNKNKERAEFYYIWICALNETHDILALNHLAKHLIGMSKDYSVFNCLAALSFHFAGKSKACFNLLKEQKKYFNFKNRYYKEALALFLSNLSKEIHFKKGIISLKKICSENSIGYLTWRNCLRVLSQHNYESSMSRMYNLMHIKFPFAHEPYIVASLVAIDEKNWVESIRLLKQIVKENPKNTEAILALAQSYYGNNQLDKAYELLFSNKTLYHDQDYDFNYLWAEMLGKIAKIENNKNKCEESIAHYDKVISLARFFTFPITTLENQRQEIVLLNNSLEVKNKLLLSIESFLEKKSEPSISSIYSFYEKKQSLKLNVK